MTSSLTETQVRSLTDVGLAALTMQPTFQLHIAMDADQVAKRIRIALEEREFRKHAKSAGRCVDFTVEPAEQRFWSPHLSVQLSDTETGSLVFGRFSPRPEVWTMFMAIYGLVAVTVFGAAIYGYAQWMLKIDPWALVVVPVGVLVIGLLHVASLIGQRLSSDQIHILLERFKSVLQTALDDSTAH